jgi:hypothetical protein
MTKYDDVEYMNSRDWVESLTALVENEKVEWSIVFYSEWKRVDDLDGYAMKVEVMGS